MLIFSTQLCKLLPLYYNLLSGSPPPLPLPKVKMQYVQKVCGGGGVGVLSCVGDHILQEFTFCI